MLARVSSSSLNLAKKEHGFPPWTPNCGSHIAFGDSLGTVELCENISRPSRQRTREGQIKSERPVWRCPRTICITQTPCVVPAGEDDSWAGLEQHLERARIVLNSRLWRNLQILIPASCRGSGITNLTDILGDPVRHTWQLLWYGFKTALDHLDMTVTVEKRSSRITAGFTREIDWCGPELLKLIRGFCQKSKELNV